MGEETTKDSTHYGFTFSGIPARLICMDKYLRRFQKNTKAFSVGIELNRSALPSDSSAIDNDYNYPIVSLGARYHFNDFTLHRSPDPSWGQAQEVDYDSKVGNILTLYGSFTRPIYRNRHWMFDYSLGTGIGYCKNKYNNYNNIDNELIGSRFLIYFVGGAHVTYHLTPCWGLSAGVEFYHHSNGALNRPNKGANVVGPVFSLRYDPYYKEVIDKPKNFNPEFQKRLYLNFTVGVGGKTLHEDWQLTQFQTHPDSADYRTSRFHFYTAYSAQADIMYRYARRWSSGIGADLFYGSYASRVEQLDKQAGSKLPHSPWSVGIALKHQVFYHQLSVAMSLGYYLYREMGESAKIIEKPYYERIGVHYSIPGLNGLTVGLNVKAHLTKADFTELIISYPITLRRK